MFIFWFWEHDIQIIKICLLMTSFRWIPCAVCRKLSGYTGYWIKACSYFPALCQAKKSVRQSCSCRLPWLWMWKKIRSAFSALRKTPGWKHLSIPENSERILPWLLVTDAIHMPRAMLLFQKAGQKPIAAPTNHLVKSKQKQDISDWGPSALNIEKMEYAMHEIFGLAWVKTGVRSRGEWVVSGE